MTDWAKKAVARAREEAKAESERTKKFNEEQELKRQDGPVLWQELKTWLHENAESFNQESKRRVMQIENMSSDRERIFCSSTGLYLNAVFDEERLTVMWHVTKMKGENVRGGNVMVGISNGRVSLMDNDLPRPIDFVGEQMLDGLLNH